jgi:hypothetical protein
MPFELVETQKVTETIEALERRDQRKHRRVVKCLALLEQDPTYPSLNSHPYEAIEGPLGEPIWESYVENNTPSAWRIWWFYGPNTGEITLVDLVPHP